MGKQHRGFASMDQSKQRLIASKGGRTAHERGTAHKWTVEEARAAGRKGGAAFHRRDEHPLEELQMGNENDRNGKSESAAGRSSA